jgi:Lon protease-like protein
VTVEDREGVAPTPMFPLGTVLFPSLYLPLHVFEPRYRELVRTCLDGDGQFGVTMIERGSEVGGGDVRTDVGTMARIAEAAELPDGRWALAAIGVHRIRVERWLADDPYPRAVVVDWPDEPSLGSDPGDDLHPVVARLRRVLALQAELGRDAPPATMELSDDPELSSHQASALAPLGPADRHALLAAPSTTARLALLDGLLEEREGDLRRLLDIA